MFEYIVKIDKQITLLINSFSSEYIDYVMILFSNKYVWIPLYMYLIYFLYTNEKKIFLKLAKNGILVRKMDVYKIKNSLRITIGNNLENKKFIKIIKNT